MERIPARAAGTPRRERRVTIAEGLRRSGGPDGPETPARRRERAARRPLEGAAARGVGAAPADLAAAGKAAGPLAAGLAEVLAIGREMLAIPAGDGCSAWPSGSAGWCSPRGACCGRSCRRAGAAPGAPCGGRARGHARPGGRRGGDRRGRAAGDLAVRRLPRGPRRGPGLRRGRGDRAAAPGLRTAPRPPARPTSTCRCSPRSPTIVIVVLVDARPLAAGARAVLPRRWRSSRSASSIDLPKGLDEGTVAIQFEGAEARLLGAFWVQLARPAR